MKTRTEKVIDTHEWDKLVIATYGRPYCFQQQEGCKSRGSFRFTVPAESQDEDMNDSIPETVNDPVMGVKFAKWLERDPKAPLNADELWGEQWCIDLWWTRNFYPDFQTVANDLHVKGLLEAGDYTIDIDW